MNWFKQLYRFAGLGDMLDSLGVSEDVKQYILSLPNEQKQYYVKLVRQNPQIDLQTLQQQVEQQQSQQIDPYLPHEYKHVENFPPQSQKWILYQLKQSRNSNLNVDQQTLFYSSDYSHYQRIISILDRWQRTNGLKDFLNANPNYDFRNRSIDEVNDDIYEWHAAMAGKGAGKFYAENNIVYGPEWKNDELDGWTIQDVTTENDLQVEGYQMDHCVGGDDYCEAVQNGDIKIFSLRDPNNQPHLTLETDPQIKQIYQIQGVNNSEPKEEYRPMIKEWFDSRDVRPEYEEQTNVEMQDVDDMINFLERIERGGGAVDDMGIQEHYDEYFQYYPQRNQMEMDWGEILQDIIIDARNEKRRSREEYYDGEITRAPEQMLDTANELGYQSLEELLEETFKSLQGFEEQMMGYLEPVEPSEPEPTPQEYNTYEEYEDAHQQWQREQEEYVDEYREEVLSEWLPTAFLKDIWKQYQKGVQKNVYPDWNTIQYMTKKQNKSEKQDEPETIIGSGSWYKQLYK